ncbi:MAG: DUF4825 domain-containing protein [Lentihominibacter sp.]|uniref:DUF4825 domain-containing protein n=1 Tax=Lentihominibacter sp. TaxID=2944216 RepID=UPI002A917052|nr:DUF4825 domain-containing protein [Lentihominibacter sp.]MDY5286211.1 DUF4825 domain-containing protein [Lentihominibacter sp.]
MKRMSSKKLVIFILCMLAVIGGTTAAVFSVSRSESKDKAEITENSSGETSVSAWKVDDSAAHAKALYKCAVSDVGDTASVVDLLEAMKLESVSGPYTAEISSKDGQEVLTLTLSDEISKKDQKVFNNNMKLCAQQMLVLIPGVQAVEWMYPVKSDSAEAEQTTVSLDVDGATEGLSHDIRSYGKSAKAVQKLLTEQTGS